MANEKTITPPIYLILPHTYILVPIPNKQVKLVNLASYTRLLSFLK